MRCPHVPSLDRRTFVRGAGASALAGGLCSCVTTNPATGERSFTGTMSTEDEIGRARARHAATVAEFGGEYRERGVQDYVRNIGNRLAANAERRLPYVFTVLNSDVMNAFTPGGGYVYITRAILALSDTEADLAGVLGHEIGHITALHPMQRQARGQVAQGGLLLGTILGAVLGGGETAQSFGQLGSVVAGGYIASYSRDQEFEADRLGVRYLSASGYDPNGIGSFLDKLGQDVRLQAQLAGADPRAVDRTHFMSTHPRTGDRVRQLTGPARAAMGPNARIGRDSHLSAVDGMVFGDDPSQGVIRGRDFLHPELRFAFTVPDGFVLRNAPTQVTARHRNGSAIAFTLDRRQTGGRMTDYLRGELAQQLAGGRGRVNFAGVEPIRVDGADAATGTTTSRQGDVRLVAIDRGGRQVAVFMFLTPRNLTRSMGADLQRTTYSFRSLSPREAAGITPLRVDVVTVRRGDTVQSLARRMPFDDFRLERFLVLNGLAPNARLRAGDKVKIVV